MGGSDMIYRIDKILFFLLGMGGSDMIYRIDKTLS
jgi:hypothetical protein